MEEGSSMISDSVIIFGATGNVVMVVNGELPQNKPIMFKVGESQIDLMSDDHVVYTEQGLNNYICQRLKQKNEIGLLEVRDNTAPPKHLTNVAYQQAS
jgi:hypothetical protein